MSLPLPLDGAFFRGDDLVSNFIGRVQKRKFKVPYDAPSHCGLIVTYELFRACYTPDPFARYADLVKLQKESPHLPLVPEEVKYLEPGRLYVLESTESGSVSDGVYSVMGEPKFGPQIRDLEKVAKAYTGPKRKSTVKLAPAVGNVWRYSLTLPHVERDRLQQRVSELFVRCFLDHRDDKYQSNVCCVAASTSSCLLKIFDCWTSMCCKCGSNEDRTFCSELVAHIFRGIHMCPPDVLPMSVAPVELLGAGKVFGGSLFFTPVNYQSKSFVSEFEETFKKEITYPLKVAPFKYLESTLKYY